MPTTWDEVFKDAEKVSDPDNDFYGLAIGCGENDDDDENTIRQYMWNEGGYLFDEDGNVAADDKVTAVFDKYAELYDDKVIPQDATTWDAGGNNGSYLAGRTAFCFNALHYTMHWYLMNNIKIYWIIQLFLLLRQEATIVYI